jgi:sRNA-binding protein
MIGIDKVLIELMQPAIKAGRISENDLRLALKRYTSANDYLKRCLKPKARINLSGEPVGRVTPVHARSAMFRLHLRRVRP